MKPETVRAEIQQAIDRKRKLYLDDPPQLLVAFRKHCEACETIVEAWEIIETDPPLYREIRGTNGRVLDPDGSLQNIVHPILKLCPECYFLYRTDFKDRGGTTSEFVRWRRDVHGKAICQRCGATLDHSITYCRTCHNFLKNLHT